MKLVTIHSQLLAPKVAKRLNLKLVRPDYKLFSDGEFQITTYDSFENEDVLIIQSMYPDQDRRFNEVKYFAHELKHRFGAKRIGAVVPYLPYQRQDNDNALTHGGHELIIARQVVRELVQSGLEYLYTVDVHSKRALINSSLWDMSTGLGGDIDPSPIFVDFLSKKQLGNLLVVAPDDNAQKKVVTVAKELGAETLFLDKQRSANGRVKMQFKVLEKAYDTAVFVDDIIEKGASMYHAGRIVRLHASKMLGICTHALMLRPALRNLNQVGINEVFSTDSIESKYSIMSLADLIAERLIKDRVIQRSSNN